MDNKEQKYTLNNVPDKLWDAIPQEAKTAVDNAIDQKIKGKASPIAKEVGEVNKSNDIA